uniref:Uncharacterized protein n=1 Tax=Arundo donax TaxID=35708 RepID=A0A0A8YX86_ARUDO
MGRCGQLQEKLSRILARGRAISEGGERCYVRHWLY